MTGCRFLTYRPAHDQIDFDQLRLHPENLQVIGRVATQEPDGIWPSAQRAAVAQPADGGE
jgi:hypothetical protein